jgi:hypothetical protein
MDAGIVVIAFLIVAQVVTILEAQHKARKLDALADQVSTLAKRIKSMGGIIKQADTIVEQHRLAAHADQAVTSHADLVEEINRLRAENAVLSGAYQFVLLEEDGCRRMVRFDLN